MGNPETIKELKASSFLMAQDMIETMKTIVEIKQHVEELWMQYGEEFSDDFQNYMSQQVNEISRKELAAALMSKSEQLLNQQLMQIEQIKNTIHDPASVTLRMESDQKTLQLLVRKVESKFIKMNMWDTIIDLQSELCTNIIKEIDRIKLADMQPTPNIYELIDGVSDNSHTHDVETDINPPEKTR